MIIHPFPSGPFSTNAYVLACPQTKKAVVVDPAPDSFDSIADYVESKGLFLDKILLTHSHWDHIIDCARFKRAYQIPIYVHDLDRPNLESPGADSLPCWISYQGMKPDHILAEGDLINVGNIEFKVIHTPGHSPGSICLYSESEKVLISGDTLFQGTIGNISFPTSQPKLMWESLKKLSKLPPETKVYPGHGSDTTIANEKWLADAERVFG